MGHNRWYKVVSACACFRVVSFLVSRGIYSKVDWHREFQDFNTLCLRGSTFECS
jgi:hypothetical protein